MDKYEKLRQENKFLQQELQIAETIIKNIFMEVDRLNITVINAREVLSQNPMFPFLNQYSQITRNNEADVITHPYDDPFAKYRHPGKQRQYSGTPLSVKYSEEPINEESYDEPLSVTDEESKLSKRPDEIQKHSEVLEDGGNVAHEPPDNPFMDGTSNNADSELIEHPAQEFGTFPYKDDIYEMSLYEFVFNYNGIMVFFSEDDSTIPEEPVDQVEFIIIPLNTKEHYPPILIWVARDGHTETYYFKNAHKPVTVTCGDYEFSITAKMNGTKFKSYILLTDQSKKQGYTADVNTKEFDGTKGHLYLKDGNTHIHVSPVTLENNEDGMANFIYCITEDGIPIRYGDNSDERIYIFDEKLKKELLVKWNDNSLYGAIAPLNS